MSRHSSEPTIEEVEDDCFIAICDCGWQSEVYEMADKALDEFETIHFLGNPRDEEYPEAMTDNSCWFCGHEGHTQKNCPRKPLYKL